MCGESLLYRKLYSKYTEGNLCTDHEMRAEWEASRVSIYMQVAVNTIGAPQMRLKVADIDGEICSGQVKRRSQI